MILIIYWKCFYDQQHYVEAWRNVTDFDPSTYLQVFDGEEIYSWRLF